MCFYAEDEKSKEVEAKDTRKKVTDGDSHRRRKEETASKSHANPFVDCSKLLNVQPILDFLMFDSIPTSYLAFISIYYWDYHWCYSSEYFCRMATWSSI